MERERVGLDANGCWGRSGDTINALVGWLGGRTGRDETSEEREVASDGRWERRTEEQKNGRKELGRREEEKAYRESGVDVWNSDEKSYEGNKRDA